MKFLDQPTRYFFFTGKGGVGKTTTACAAALALAERGRRVLLVSTDPASNLDEVLGVRLGAQPTLVPDAPGLEALNIDPEAAARAYRERVVGPYRGVLPTSAVRSIEEQLSGACTVEIAAFDEFSRLLGDAAATAVYDHVLFDTAPTGHTLRLLQLPAAWHTFIETNMGGTSCLGPLAGLKSQQALYAATLANLQDGDRTRVVLVARPEVSSLIEAERARAELTALGIAEQHLVLNGLFHATLGDDAVAAALEARGAQALAAMPEAVARLPRTEIPLLPVSATGLAGLRAVLDPASAGTIPTPSAPIPALPSFACLIDEIAAAGGGVVMTMGKGGVGKTTLAAAIAVALVARGQRVHLSTTDPAAHVQATLAEAPPGLTVNRIDPRAETAAYAREVLDAARANGLDGQGLALLEEDLRSPCTEEIAVFRAFAQEVERGRNGFVVLDTAPTGHTLLLLDATEAYHREVDRGAGGEVPEAVRALLPRLRDPAFTRVLIVTLPEATPVHEAEVLQADLERAGIAPFAWIVNQSFAPTGSRDPVIASRRALEQPWIEEVSTRLARRAALVPWQAAPPVGVERLRALLRAA
ncbi:MAG: arsenical pump-driving ATPase [Gammaproteobacteria bacterium]|nr:arsenical pump-driving ATPase [Gammaproteobacteria bacterium]